jgi:DNA helicase-2/ATP-dependent DNA helicase PcrA
MPPRIYPSRFLDSRPNRGAEQRVFEALAEQLPGDYLIIHDAAWIRPGSPPFAQIDFVIASPSLGVLVLEVKGGRRLIVEGKRWSMEKHNGEVINYKIAPHEQSERAMWALFDLLQARSDRTFPKKSIVYAVCFPDLIVESTTFDATLDREVVIDHADLMCLPQALDRIRMYWQRMTLRSRRPIGRKWLDFVKDTLARDVDLQALLGSTLLAERAEAFTRVDRFAGTLFSQEQWTVIDRGNRMSRLAVGGCAGSGKTLLAVALARKHAASRHRVLLVCYNRPLSDQLRRWLSDVASRVRVATFDELVQQTTGELRIDLDEVPYAQQGALIAGRASASFSVSRSLPRYDAIIVDEGQDFDKAWWPLIECFLQHPEESSLLIFCDNNQRIYGRQEGLPVTAHLPLTINFRTTRSIHRLVEAFYVGEMRPREFVHEGEATRFISYTGSTDDLRRRLIQVLDELHRGGVQPKDIAVLSARGVDSSRLASLASELHLESDPNSENMVWASIYRFKGLERPVVILIELDPDVFNRIETDELLYVGYSRASQRLTVIHHIDVPADRLRERLARVSMVPEKLLIGLNEEQYAAVTAPLGIQQVYAGAGTGKTRVLTRRIAYLIGSCHVNPRSILAMTFTTKAAREIRERIAGLCDVDSAKAMTVGTFHAVCRRLLQEEIPHLEPPRFEGRRADFTIAKESETRKWLREAVNRASRLVESDAVLARARQCKQEGLLLSEAAANSPSDSAILDVASSYDKYLRDTNQMDFEDLLLLTVRLLYRYGEVLERIRTRYRHILVDELQDTNEVQFDLVHLLTLGRQSTALEQDRSLLVVGDAQQSIYQWRGARYELFRDFAEHFPEVSTYELIRNYRSSQHIIDIALSVAREEITGVPPLDLVADDPALLSAPPVTILTFDTEGDEAHRLAKFVREAIDDGVVPDEIVILLRARRGSEMAVTAQRLIETALRDEQVPFQARGFDSFYGSAVVQDTVALLWAALEPQRNEAFRAALNTRFFHGIGPAIAERLAARSREQGFDSLWDFLTKQSNTLLFDNETTMTQISDLGIVDVGQQRQQTISDGVGLLRSMQQRARDGETVGDWLRGCIVRAGVRDRYANERNREDLSAILDALVTMLCEECATIEDLPAALSTFAVHTEASGTGDFDTDVGGYVQLTSVHAVKGLEFEIVIIPALEDGLFPSQLDQQTPEELLEAGRLYYVAVTRPRRQLILSYAQQRDNRPRQPSPFIQAVRGSIEAQSRWRAYANAFERPAEVPDAILVEAVDRPIAGKDWATINRVADEFPGHLPVEVLGLDSSGVPSVVESGQCIAQHAIDQLGILLGRRCVPIQKRTIVP